MKILLTASGKKCSNWVNYKKRLWLLFQASQGPEFQGVTNYQDFLILSLLSSVWPFLSVRRYSGGGEMSNSSSKSQPHSSASPRGRGFYFATCSSTFSGSGPIGQTWVTCPGPKSHTHLRSGGGYCHIHQNHLGSLSGAVVPQRKKELLMSQGGTVGTG